MHSNLLIGVLAGAVFASVAVAKIPVPELTDEQKAKAAETKARADWNAAMENFRLCRSMDRVAERYARDLKAKGQTMKPAEAPACKDPGPFQPVAATPAAAVAAPPPVTKK
jgi:hypothetical protein